MSNTYTWSIVAIDYDIVMGEKVPTTVHWTCSGHDDFGNKGYSYGTYSVAPSARSGIQWEGMTEQDALAWLEAEMSVATLDVNEEGESTQSEKQRIESIVDAQIEEMAHPTHGTGLPWATEPEAVEEA